MLPLLVGAWALAPSSAAQRVVPDFDVSINTPTLTSNDWTFGVSVAYIGDLNGDSIIDLVVGAPTDRTSGMPGYISVLLMTSQNTALSTINITNGEGGFSGSISADGGFGSAVAGIGDLDGDGVLDMAASAPGDGTGVVHVLFMHGNGTVKRDSSIAAGVGGFSETLGSNAGFGSALALLGDLDANSTPELATSSINSPVSGAVWILSLYSDGSVTSYAEISATSGGMAGSLSGNIYFGSSIAALWDADGNGVIELAVGATGDTGEEGYLFILFLNSSMMVESSNSIPNPRKNPSIAEPDVMFGYSVAALGDVDDDGFMDVVVGAPAYSSYRGLAHVITLDANGSQTDSYPWFYDNRYAAGQALEDLTMHGFSVSADVSSVTDSYLTKGTLVWGLPSTAAGGTGALAFSGYTVGYEAPTIYLGSSGVTFNEGDTSLAVLSGISVSAPSGDTVTADVTLTNYVSGQDSLAMSPADARADNSSAGASTGSSPTISIAALSPSVMSSVLGKVVFVNTDIKLTSYSRKVSVSVTTSTGGKSETKDVDITVVPMNSVPTLSINGTSAANYTEDGNKVNILQPGVSVNITDIDHDTMGSLEVDIGAGCDDATDRLEVDGSSSSSSLFSGSWSSDSSCTLTVTARSGVATSTADWEVLFSDIVFYSTNSSAVDESTTRQFGFKVFDDLDTSLRESASVSTSSDFVVNLFNYNDPPTIVLPSGAGFRSGTPVMIKEESDGGTNLTVYGSTMELLVYDPDSGRGTITLEIVRDGTDQPVLDVLNLTRLDVSSDYIVYETDGVTPRTTLPYFGAERFRFFAKDVVDTVVDPSTQRNRSQYLDHENLDPVTRQPDLLDSFEMVTRTFAMNIVATDESGARSQPVRMYIRVYNVPEPPVVLPLVPPGQADIQGLYSGVQGFISSRGSYIDAINGTFSVQANATIASGRLQVDNATHDIVYGNRSSPSHAPLQATYYKIDMIHGQLFSTQRDAAEMFFDPEGGVMTPSLTWLGFQNKDGTGNFTEVNQLVNSVGTNVYLPVNTTAIADAGLLADSVSNSFFDPLNPLKFECDSTGCTLSGKPEYDTYLPSLQMLNAEVGQRASPKAKTLRFALEVTDPEQLSATAEFWVDVEIQGCMDIRASFVGCAGGGTFEAKNCTNQLQEGTGGSNLGSFIANGFNPLNSSTYTAELAPANPEGSFNEEATVPGHQCSRAPIQFGPGAGRKQVAVSAAAESAQAAESMLEGLSGAALQEKMRALRGSAYLDVDTDLINYATQFTIEYFDATRATVTPPDYTVIPSLAFQVGPAGYVIGTSQDGVPGFRTVVYPGEYDTTTQFCAPLHASLRDVNDPSLGYNAAKPCEYVAVATGGACTCFHSSNSIVIPAFKALPQPSFLPSRFYQSGGGCPSECSGHGFCRAHGKCACFAGWGGYDCASRECPYAEAWAADDSISRRPLECSGRGSCDRSSGTCGCFDGFEGPACERLSCPSGCSGHGRCRYINELPDVTGYSEWDAERIQACVCDGGYFGVDCSLRTCPRGDDPQTLCDAGQNHKQTVTVSLPRTTAGNNAIPADTGAIALRFTGADGTIYRLPRIDDVVPRTAASYAPADVKARIESAFRALPSFAVDDITVTPPTSFDPAAETAFEIEVEFTGKNTPGDQSLLECSLSCPLPGCRPKHNQLRISDTSALSAVEPSPHLEIETPTGSGAVGVRFHFTFTVASGLGSSRYSFELTSQGLDSSGSTVGSANVLITAPVPLNGKEIVVSHGFRFSIDSTAIAGASTEQVDYYPATCSVAVFQRAGYSFESAECSNRGLCDRSSGLCQCFEGYAGAACSDDVVTY